jgi:hypothetical protein
MWLRPGRGKRKYPGDDEAGGLNSDQKAAEPAFSTIALGRGGGEMGGSIRGFDWSKTALGPITHWPQSLRTVVNILLSSRYVV